MMQEGGYFDRPHDYQTFVEVNPKGAVTNLKMLNNQYTNYSGRTSWHLVFGGGGALFFLIMATVVMGLRYSKKNFSNAPGVAISHRVENVCIGSISLLASSILLILLSGTEPNLKAKNPLHVGFFVFGMSSMILAIFCIYNIFAIDILDGSDELYLYPMFALVFVVFAIMLAVSLLYRSYMRTIRRLN